MKKTIFSADRLAIALLCAIVAVIPALTSCEKGKSADLSDIIASVPSSASVVVGVNLASMLDKAECKVEGSVITPGKEVEQVLNSSTIDKKAKDACRMLLSGESGIDPTGVIIFSDAYDVYLTGVVADTEKFKAFAQQQSELPFEEAAKEILTSGPFALHGAQMWLSLSSSSSIDAKAIKNYTALELAQSFSSLPVAAEIANMTHDVVGYGQIQALSRSNLSFSDVATVNFLTGFLFDKATALSFNLDFLKGEVKFKSLVLNSEYKPAKYLLPSDKVSTDLINRLPASSNAIAAISLPKSLIKKLTEMTGTLNSSLPDLSSALSSIDGTTAIALSDIDNPTETPLCALISTDGKPSLNLLQILSIAGNTQKDGNVVKVTKGEVSGEIETAKAADILKGSTFGLVFNSNSKELLKGASLGINTVAFTLNPGNGSLSLNLMCKTTEPDVNSLLTILKKAAM